MSPWDHRKPLAWLHGEVKTPPFSQLARVEAERDVTSFGFRMRNKSWRIVYRIDEDAILILHVFEKKTQQTPPAVIDVCRQRIKRYDGR